MSSRVRLFLGIFTSVLFLAIGGLMFAEQRPLYGAIVMALGILRGILAIRQVRMG
jgi:hypothetical protein